VLFYTGVYRYQIPLIYKENFISMHPSTQTPSHPLTFLPNQRKTHSHIHNHSSSNQPSIQSSIYPFNNPSEQPSIHSLIHSNIIPWIQSPIYLITLHTFFNFIITLQPNHSCTQSTIHSITNWHNYPSIKSPINSNNSPPINPNI